MKRIFISTIIFWTICSAFGQTDSLIAKQNRLLSNEKLLIDDLDSLSVLLDKKRADYSHTSNDEIANEIIRLENQIYDLKSMLSKIGVQLAHVEAMVAKSGDAAINTTVNGNSDNKSLLKNSFFTQNVSSKDISIMMINKEAQIAAIKSKIDQLYAELLELKTQYDNAQTQDEVNIMMSQAAELRSEIGNLNSQIESVWSKIYNRKIDNYIVLVDKLPSVGRDHLEMIDQLGREVIQTETQLSNNSIAPHLALLPYQKNLVLGYELALAKELKLTQALDSIQKIGLKKISAKKYDDIVFPYRSVVVYGSISVNNDHQYNDLDSIPTLKLPGKGLYYSVQVAYVTGKASSLSIFKGGEPLQQEVVEAKTRYVLGGFNAYSDAAEAVKDCYKFGFKYPVIVAWIDGKNVSVEAAQAYQKANPGQSLANGYKVEMITDNLNFASRLKTIVDIHAAGKIITRTSSNDNEYLYCVSKFMVYEEAKVFAEIVKTNFNTLQIEVLPINKGDHQPLD